MRTLLGCTYDPNKALRDKDETVFAKMCLKNTTDRYEQEVLEIRKGMVVQRII